GHPLEAIEMHRQILPLRFITLLSAPAVVAAAILLVSLPSAAQQASNNAAVERGRYLVTITGCHDCHSPKVEGMKPDLARALSGRPPTTQLPTVTTTEVH